jgi:hypothetical protein
VPRSGSDDGRPDLRGPSLVLLVAFRIIEGQDLLLFLFFALGMLVGVASPVICTVWGRGRDVATRG